MSDEVKAIAEQPDTLVITLKQPVMLGDQAYTELRLREPTGGEMISCEGLLGWDLDISLIALISGVPKPALIKVGTKDLTRARNHLALFFD